MELPRRARGDEYLPEGAFTRICARLRARPEVADLRVVVSYAFDFRTRMLPYFYADKRMSSCAVRTLTDVMHAAGLRRIRAVLQQWTPNFRPSEAQLDGAAPDILMVSAMQVHAERAYELIRDAHKLGPERPLIIAGGPKAVYEPTDYFNMEGQAGIGADCVVTGEAYVMLELLETILNNRCPGESMRTAFDRARLNGDLSTVPGLVYLSPERAGERQVAVSTGVQRLLRDLDEMPLPDAGFRLLERPHRGRRLKPRPLSAGWVKWYSPIASLIATQGCKFNCDYCPIPALNQRTWRHKSPARMAEEILHVHETFGVRHFFGTDDNFFNDRQTVIDLMTALASARTSRGRRLGSEIYFYTEATEFDVHKNQDLLELCRKGGLRGIWFGLEDLTAELVNKGQTPGKTAQIFEVLCKLGIQPMAMVIHSDSQPVHSPPDDLSGLVNQAKYLREKGAVSYQCTYLGPAVGTRSFDDAVVAGTIMKTVGHRQIPQAYFDGNHVIASTHAKPWRRQLNVLRGYWAFYNPINTLRALCRAHRGSVPGRRALFQIIGQIGLLMTLPKLLRWAWKLRSGPIERWTALDPMRIPLVDATTGEQVNWTFDYPLDPKRSVAPKSMAPSREIYPPAIGGFADLALPVLR